MLEWQADWHSWDCYVEEEEGGGGEEEKEEELEEEKEEEEAEEEEFASSRLKLHHECNSRYSLIIQTYLLPIGTIIQVSFHVVYTYPGPSSCDCVPSLYFTRWLPAPTTKFLFQSLIILFQSLNPLHLRTGYNIHESGSYMPVPAIEFLFQSIHGVPVARHPPSLKKICIYFLF